MHRTRIGEGLGAASGSKPVSSRVGLGSLAKAARSVVGAVSTAVKTALPSKGKGTKSPEIGRQPFSNLMETFSTWDEGRTITSLLHHVSDYQSEHHDQSKLDGFSNPLIAMTVASFIDSIALPSLAENRTLPLGQPDMLQTAFTTLSTDLWNISVQHPGKPEEHHSAQKTNAWDSLSTRGVAVVQTGGEKHSTKLLLVQTKTGEVEGYYIDMAFANPAFASASSGERVHQQLIPIKLGPMDKTTVEEFIEPFLKLYAEGVSTGSVEYRHDLYDHTLPYSDSLGVSKASGLSLRKQAIGNCTFMSIEATLTQMVYMMIRGDIGDPCPGIRREDAAQAAKQLVEMFLLKPLAEAISPYKKADDEEATYFAARAIGTTEARVGYVEVHHHPERAGANPTKEAGIVRGSPLASRKSKSHAI